MRVAPFQVKGINQQTVAMGMQMHLVPQSHALFFGPAGCALHNSQYFMEDPYASMLVISDVQTSLGMTEDLVMQAVNELAEEDPQHVKAFILCTACQTAFTGVDPERLCLDLHESTGLYFAHIEMNRMRPENIPGKTRKDVPGGDRFHSRLSFVRMLSQAPTASEPNGILVLTEDALDPTCDLFALKQIEGVDWVRGMGDMCDIDAFLECRNARVTIATSMAWKEAGEWMQSELGIPTLYLPTSYSFKEIESYYVRLGALLPPTQQMLAQREQNRKAALKAFRHTRNALQGRSIDLDLRVVNRPFSLAETMLEYGFNVGNVIPDMMHVWHKEADDLPAFERLAAENPEFGRQFASRNRRDDRKRPNRTKNNPRPGRFIPDMRSRQEVQRVPEETAWWGYSSITKLMEEISPSRPRGKQGRARQEGWSL